MAKPSAKSTRRRAKLLRKCTQWFFRFSPRRAIRNARPVTPLPKELILRHVQAALAEDIGAGDTTTLATVPESAVGRAAMVAREELVVCGLPLAEAAFQQQSASCQISSTTQDGSRVHRGDPLMEVRGAARALLTAERVALNFMGHLSGVATATHQLVERIAGTKARIICTRKTTPGLRVLEKYAVRCGGGTNHRQRLDDGILIKDNHKRLAGGVGAAASRAMAQSQGLPVEVEVENLAELDEALKAGVPRILLDNFTTDDIREAVARVNGKADIEISGGVTLDRIPELASTGAQYVSIGALTHSAPAADLSFELEPAE